MYVLNFCYLCLCDYNNLKSVLIKDNDGIIVENKIKYCFSEIIDLQPANSKYICNICLANLNSFYNFKQTCLKNNTTMNNYLRNIISTGDSNKEISLQVLDTHPVNLESTTNSKILLVRVTTKNPIAKQENNQSDDVLLSENSLSLPIKEEQITKNETETNEELIPTEYEIDIKEEPADIEDGDIVIKEECTIEDNNQEHDTFYNSPKNESEENIQKNNETSMQCDVCNKIFTIRRLFLRHQRRHVKNLKCRYCDKTFGDCTLRRKHERIHTGIKNYSCSICNKRFTQGSNLKSHEKTHIGNKDFECTICQKRFTQKGHVTLHMKIHTDRKDYECLTCGKQFTQKGNLIWHEKVHSDDKEFQCSVCQKKFIRRKYYENHINRHHQTFKCTICDEVFEYMTALTAHTEDHHTELIENFTH